MHYITPYIGFNYWLKREDTELNEPTKQNALIVLEVVEANQ